MNKKLKNLLKKILLSLTIFLLAIIMPLNIYIKISLYIASYLIVGYEILLKSFYNIRNGEIFDENLLMIIATFVAFILGEYTEAIAIILFYQIGEFFQSYAVNNSRKSISKLMNIRPDYANIEKDGEIVFNEGCLSVPEFYEEIKRANTIKIAYQDRFGTKQEIVATNYLAVAFQHEIDHLNGVLFIDKLSIIKRKKFEKGLKQKHKF